MRKALPLLFRAFFTALACASAPDAVGQDAAKNIQPSPEPAAAAPARLSNQDVLQMTRAGLTPEIIATKIRSATGDFDTSPAALRGLKGAGVHDSVLLAMVEGARPAAAGGGEAAARAPVGRVVEVRLPAGTRVEVEAAYRVSSQEVRAGDLLTFRVVNPVKVEGVTVIEPGAVATARVVKASRGGHFGRAGRLAWSMYEVTAADGTRVAIESQGRRVGDSKGAKVATQMAITAAAMPLIAPVALLHGFKRGENAYLPEGFRFDAVVKSEATVAGRVMTTQTPPE